MPFASPDPAVRRLLASGLSDHWQRIETPLLDDLLDIEKLAAGKPHFDLEPQPARGGPHHRGRALRSGTGR